LRSKSYWRPTRGFEKKALKKTARSARSDKEDCGDCSGDEETDGNALRDDLQDASSVPGEL
jgi:hypothetical protein